jgi:hypothetical protein
MIVRFPKTQIIMLMNRVYEEVQLISWFEQICIPDSTLYKIFGYAHRALDQGREVMTGGYYFIGPWHDQCYMNKLTI